MTNYIGISMVVVVFMIMLLIVGTVFTKVKNNEKRITEKLNADLTIRVWHSMMSTFKPVINAITKDFEKLSE